MARYGPQRGPGFRRRLRQFGRQNDAFHEILSAFPMPIGRYAGLMGISLRNRVRPSVFRGLFGEGEWG